MRKKSRIALIAVIALIAGGIPGCGKRVEYMYLETRCQVPPLVSEADLPRVDAGDVYDALEAYHGDEKGRAIAEGLRARERIIIDNLLEHRAILQAVCEGGE